MQCSLAITWHQPIQRDVMSIDRCSIYECSSLSPTTFIYTAAHTLCSFPYTPRYYMLKVRYLNVHLSAHVITNPQHIIFNFIQVTTIFPTHTCHLTLTTQTLQDGIRETGISRSYGWVLSYIIFNIHHWCYYLTSPPAQRNEEVQPKWGDTGYAAAAMERGSRRTAKTTSPIEL